MAKFCSNCGKPLRDGVRFCGNCGKKIAVPSEPTSRNSNDSNDLSDYGDMIVAGAGMLAGAAVTANPTEVHAQPVVTPVNSPPPSADVNNFFGFAQDGLHEITGSVDVTNIVAHVAHSFGVQNVAEYADIITDGADELIDAAADAIGDVAGEAAGEAASGVVDVLLEIISSA